MEELSKSQSLSFSQNPKLRKNPSIFSSSNNFFFFNKKFLTIILSLTILIIFLIGLQYWQYQNLKNISCGGDYSYKVKCPIGTYCRSLNMGPYAGGVCTPYLFGLTDFFTSKLSSTSISIVREITPTPATSINLKTYANTKYDFEFSYPAKGITQKGNKFSEVECGNAIKETNDLILVDNLFKIEILNWTKTIDDYLISKGAKKTYEFDQIPNTGADEAIKVKGIKKGLELVSVGYPALMNIQAIYKKGDNLFLIVNFEDASNVGCINPKDLDHTKYPKYANQKWNVIDSFRFYNSNEQTRCDKDEECEINTCNCDAVKKSANSSEMKCQMMCLGEAKCINKGCVAVINKVCAGGNASPSFKYYDCPSGFQCLPINPDPNLYDAPSICIKE